MPRIEDEAHLAAPRRHDHRPEEEIGPQDPRGRAVDGREPPGMPGVVQHQHAPVRSVGFDSDEGVAADEEASGSGACRPRRRPSRIFLQQNGGPEVDLRRNAGGEERLEADERPVGREQQPRQCALVFVDEGGSGAGAQRERIGREPGVERFDRHRRRDPPETQKIREQRAPGREGGGEASLIDRGDGVLCAHRRDVMRGPQRIVAEGVLEAADERCVRPGVAETDELDAGCVLGRFSARELGDDVECGLARAGIENRPVHLASNGQSRGSVRPVVAGEIEHREQHERPSDQKAAFGNRARETDQQDRGACEPQNRFQESRCGLPETTAERGEDRRTPQTRERTHHARGPTARSRIVQHPVQSARGRKREREGEEKGGIGRAPEELYAGKPAPGELEERRVSAQSVKKRDGGGEEEEAALRPGRAGGPGRHQHKEARGSQIKHAHVLRQKEIRIRPGERRWPPEIGHRATGPEQMRCQKSEQEGGMERAAVRSLQVDGGAVRARGLESGEKKRDSRRDDRESGGEAQRQERTADRRQPVRGSEPAPGDEGRGEIGTEKSYLVATREQQGEKRPACASGAPGRARDRAVEGEQQPGQDGERVQLTHVLEAPGHRAAGHEKKTSEESRGRAQPAIDRPQGHPCATQKGQGEDGDVEGARVGVGQQRGQSEKVGRKQKGLRIRDVREAGEQMRHPKRALARGQTTSEETEMRPELRLGVPGNGDRAREPGPSVPQPAEQKTRAGENGLAVRKRSDLPGAFTGTGAERHGRYGSCREATARTKLSRRGVREGRPRRWQRRRPWRPSAIPGRSFSCTG